MSLCTSVLRRACGGKMRQHSSGMAHRPLGGLGGITTSRLTLAYAVELHHWWDLLGRCQGPASLSPALLAAGSATGQQGKAGAAAMSLCCSLFLQQGPQGHGC